MFYLWTKAPKKTTWINQAMYRPDESEEMDRRVDHYESLGREVQILGEGEKPNEKPKT